MDQAFERRKKISKKLTYLLVGIILLGFILQFIKFPVNVAGQIVPFKVVTPSIPFEVEK
jgi:uncharacterized protein (DUF697 family)